MVSKLPNDMLRKLLHQSFVIVVLWIMKICLTIQAYFQVLSHLSRQSDQADNAIFDPQANVVATGHFIITIHIHDMIKHIVAACTLRIPLSVLQVNDYVDCQILSSAHLSSLAPDSEPT